MFGYININQDELSEEDRTVYEAYYCGLCQELKGACGRKGQLLLDCDMTFLAVLLTGLYGLEDCGSYYMCKRHPIHKKEIRTNEATRYVADMNLLIGYYKLMRGLRNEKQYLRYGIGRMLQKDHEKICKAYPRQARAVKIYAKRMSRARQQHEKNVDLIASITGEMMGVIFAWKQDEWEEELWSLGFYMGKFIYLLEAFEALEENKRRMEYNPLQQMQQESQEDFDTFCKLILTSMMAECERSLERMPQLQYSQILKNILCFGVWDRYEEVCRKRQKEKTHRKKRTKE